MMRGLYLALSGLLFGAGPLWAQPAVSLVVAGRYHLMRARFAGPSPAGSGVTIVPEVYRAGALGVVVGVSPRDVLHATAGVTSYGLAFNVATFQQDALEFALVLRRHYGTAAKPGRTWMADAGVDMVYLGSRFGGASFGFGGADPNNTSGPGSASRGEPVGGRPYRVGLRLGAGREWPLGPRHYVSLAAVASVGLQDLQRFELQSVVWQQGPTIDPVSYRSTVATRLSFVAIQAQYRFALLPGGTDRLR